MKKSYQELYHYFLTTKKEGYHLAALTAYDYGMARLLDDTGIDLILVGDSLGMVALGYPDTTLVTLEDILHHLKAVRRGVKKATLIADLPYGTADSPAQAVKNATQLYEAGADIVKLEGPLYESVKAITQANIPLIAHIGMLPQKIKEEGAYRKKGKTAEEKARLCQEAQELQAAGASAIVLEGILSSVAQEITNSLTIPTIGIGSGKECDGQILVMMDILGLQPWFCPPFVTPKANLAEAAQQAFREYIKEVKEKVLF